MSWSTKNPWTDPPATADRPGAGPIVGVPRKECVHLPCEGIDGSARPPRGRFLTRRFPGMPVPRFPLSLVAGYVRGNESRYDEDTPPTGVGT